MDDLSQHVLEKLRRFESRNVTHFEPDGSWPIVWEKAEGTSVWDLEGRKYLDLTAAFGVAAAGHANPGVVEAGKKQMARLLHAMGDVHPHRLKADLAEQLSNLTFERWSVPGKPKSGKTIFCNSGFEAVEAAMKTALLATGRPGIICFEAAYHGLGFGSLNATHRLHFRGPFRPQLKEFAHFVPFPKTEEELLELSGSLRRLIEVHEIGAVLVEPIQARGGINIPPPEFLPMLRALSDEHDLCLVVDEIFTGFGRTGAWFACEKEGVIPDLICLGKALTGGFPLSACVGESGLMDRAWPTSEGESMHTSTFLGHPVGCAMALAQIGEIRRLDLTQQSMKLGNYFLAQMRNLKLQRTNVRGSGLMLGIEFLKSDGTPDTARCLGLVKSLLKAGFIVLPEGEHANVLSFTPPLTITKSEIDTTIEALRLLDGDAAGPNGTTGKEGCS